MSSLSATQHTEQLQIVLVLCFLLQNVTLSDDYSAVVRRLIPSTEQLHNCRPLTSPVSQPELTDLHRYVLLIIQIQSSEGLCHLVCLEPLFFFFHTTTH